ncbi:MAG: serine/threonine protein kinase [Deltaproteobacteria bacterium]|nr:serine/threonine protein kinase [Deltaproteobacteria bacterium]
MESPSDTGKGGPASRGSIGRYRVLRHIARGGMAEISLACAEGTQGFAKPVVIKRVLHKLVEDPKFVTMFLDEMRIAAALDHSNIVRAYDVGKSEGEYFLAMEFLDGEDLSRILRALAATGQSLPLEHAIGIVCGVCAGLHYAHEKVGLDGKPLGIVHRDVSPENIFVTFDGDVKLLDFGVAKSRQQMLHTDAGVLKGKLRYLSPDQCRDAPLDRRSDIYTVSVVRGELVTQRKLVRGKARSEVLRAIVEEDAPPPSAFEPDFPVELERIVMKGLARDPAQRYQTAQELQLALEGYVRARRLPVSPVALGRTMRELFDWKAESWLSPERKSLPFAVHVARSVGEDMPDLPSDASSDEPAWFVPRPGPPPGVRDSKPGEVAEAPPADSEDRDTVAGYRKPTTEPGSADRRGAGRAVVIVAAVLLVLAVAGIAFWRYW